MLGSFHLVPFSFFYIVTSSISTFSSEIFFLSLVECGGAVEVCGGAVVDVWSW